MKPSAHPAEFDVLIAGGGLVGGSLAIALAQTPCRVALIEAVPPDSAVQPSFDDRMIALSHGSHCILDSLGVWSLLGDAAWPIRQIHVSEQGRFGTALIDADEQGLSALGFVINSRVLGQKLWQRLAELPSITRFCPAQAELPGNASGVPDTTRTVSLRTGNERMELRTRLLVVADGARSPLRAALDIAAADRDYDQVAVVMPLAIDPRYAGEVAYERFTPSGPLAILPGRAGQYTAVLACTKAEAPTVMAMDDTTLLDKLQAQFGFRLGRFRQVGKRETYPLSLVTAETVVTERAVLIGNAASGLHPVAAQGFNLGLRDAAILAELIADRARQAGSRCDPGAPGLLADYAQWRQGDRTRVVAFTDGLIRLFGIDSIPLSIGRGLGLAAFDVVPGAKRELARQTMGLAGRLSRLARGLQL